MQQADRDGHRIELALSLVLSWNTALYNIATAFKAGL